MVTSAAIYSANTTKRHTSSRWVQTALFSTSRPTQRNTAKVQVTEPIAAIQLAGRAQLLDFLVIAMATTPSGLPTIGRIDPPRAKPAASRSLGVVFRSRFSASPSESNRKSKHPAIAPTPAPPTNRSSPDTPESFGPTSKAPRHPTIGPTIKPDHRGKDCSGFIVAKGTRSRRYTSFVLPGIAAGSIGRSPNSYFSGVRSKADFCSAHCHFIERPL